MDDEEQALRLTLYVAGQNPKAERAMANLRHAIRQRLGITPELQTVDVLDHPSLAEEALILATPTLIKETPEPPRRIMGDLSDTQKVLEGLQLVAPKEPASDASPADD